MPYLSSLLYLISAFCLRSATNYKQSPIDDIFVAWNKATYLSLTKERAKATDSSKRHQYEDRIEDLKYIFTNKDLDAIDSGSLRYQFLRKLSKDIGDGQRIFYVIEANQNGAKVLLRDFVVYFNAPNQVSVDVYVFGRDGWFKQAEVKKMSCTILDGFEKNYAKLGHGFNEDDVIITKFEKNTVKYSEYFLSATLTATSGIKAILATDNTKNFIN